MVQAYPFMYAAVGVHPDEVGALNEERLEEMRKLCEDPKVVAIGEIGLDYYWDKEAREERDAGSSVSWSSQESWGCRY